MATPMVGADAASTWLDRVIGWMSPRTGLARHFDRQRLARAYEAASPRDPWKPRRPGAGANTDHAADAAIIRAKARTLVQNVPYVRAALDALVDNVVGTGITSYSTAPDEAERATIDALWAQWCTQCDADGRLDWHGIEAAAYRAMEQDGEVLIRLRPRLATDGLAVPLQIQLLEIDWLDTQRSNTAAGGNQVINGIEYDSLGRVAAYWLYDAHPGEQTTRNTVRLQSRRVAADRIIHLYAPERPGQGRGISRLAPVIPRVRDLQLYEDAEIARKNLESRLGVIVSGDVAAMAQPQAYGSPVDTTAAQQTGDLGQLPSGGITSLPPGLNVTTVAPNATPGHTDYVKQQLHIIAAGMGVTYEMMTGDMRDTNFSSARVRLIDFRRHVESVQWLCLVPRLLRPVWRAFIDAAVLGRQLSRPSYAVDHSTPKWEYVNPAQDADSELKLISSGLLTVSESLRRRGYKPDEVFAELKADFDLLKSNGVLDVLLALQGRSAATSGASSGNAAAADAAAARAIAQHALDRAASRQPDLHVHATPEIRAQIDMPTPPPAPDVHLHVDQLRAEVHANLQADVHVPAPPAPQVDVHNHITTPAPEVRAEVHVPAAQVDVHNHITTPRRRIDGMVERDAQGRVLRTTQIETDLPDAAGADGQ